MMQADFTNEEVEPVAPPLDNYCSHLPKEKVKIRVVKPKVRTEKRQRLSRRQSS